ncbi:MAG TPA: sigma-54 dependent transcriptional regulator [bacterium]|nr:sigma-54 dependent transcriptional regulator [bacterium]HQG44146.1 sigma-54 dependent transcriptional regulator [bacterium]HQJ64152.1 sigma-54 dependent transcriptional regulator [bacterium]
MSDVIYPDHPVLLVDDEEQFLRSASYTLISEGITNVETCQESRQVMERLARQSYALVVLDMMMPHLSGEELLKQIVRDYPEVPVVIITAINEVEWVVKTIKAGAFDYLVKPVDDARLVTVVVRALQLREVRDENILLKQYLLSARLEHPEKFAAIITESQAMRGIFQYIEAIARTPLPVLITGETGTGKELIARALHDVSGRSGEFVALNVAGVDDHFFSDTLFGHTRGAFTGADRERKGLIEQAAGGTLFLDEIGDLSLESQVKLLRLLQEAEYYPLGADTTKTSDARVVVATLRGIEYLQKSDRFRKDLYYRLKSHHIALPPLRQRREDIHLLVDHFLLKAADKLGKRRITPPKELYALLANYPFPGNIRELEGMIDDAVSRHQGGVLSLEPFRRAVDPGWQEGEESGSVVEEPAGEGAIAFGEILPTLRQAEKALIAEALRRAENNQGIAAGMLGLTRRALNNRLQREK